MNHRINAVGPVVIHVMHESAKGAVCSAVNESAQNIPHRHIGIAYNGFCRA